MSSIEELVKELRSLDKQFVHQRDNSFARMADSAERAFYAIECCSRYFEHCERVSISARKEGCDSAEMNIRLSLKDDAKAAIANAQPQGEI